MQSLVECQAERPTEAAACVLQTVIRYDGFSEKPGYTMAVHEEG